MTLKPYLLAALSLIFLFQCSDPIPGEEDQPTPRSMLSGAIGKSNEVVVVCSDSDWEGKLGDSLRIHLAGWMPMTPQPEQLFRLLHYPPDRFSRVVKQYKNIVIVEIKNNIAYKDGLTITLNENVYSRGQLIFKVGAKSKSDWLQGWTGRAQQVIDRIKEEEVVRTQAHFADDHNGRIKEIFQRDYNIKLEVPRNMSIVKRDSNFVMLKRDMSRVKDGRAHDAIQGVIIYEYPYTNDSTFTKSALIAKRNAVLKKNVPGPEKGTWMTTESLVDPLYKEISLNGEYAVELKGLWRIENFVRGGPFLSVTMLDEKRNRIVTAEGYVFGPKFKKRQYLLDLEAIIKGVTFD